MTARFNDADAFVPLTPAAPPAGGASSRATLLPRSAAPCVAPAGLPAAHPEPSVSAARPCSASPRVSLQRQGDLVTGIRIECVCGHIIDLACVYPEPPAAQ